MDWIRLRCSGFDLDLDLGLDLDLDRDLIGLDWIGFGLNSIGLDYSEHELD